MFQAAEKAINVEMIHLLKVNPFMPIGVARISAEKVNSGTAIGAGVGAAIGGPVGAVAGAVVGAAVGAITAVHKKACIMQ